MGWVARVRQFVRGTRGEGKISRVTVDRGGDLPTTGDHFDGAGADAFPLDTDYALGVDTPGEDRGQIAAYADPINTPKTAKGERRIYARDPDSGAAVNEVWVKNDGTVLLDNENGSITIEPDGTVEITNGGATFTVKADGSIKGDNGSGFFELLANGTLDLNTATIDPAGNLICTSVTTGALSASAGATVTGSVAATGDVTAGGISVQNHTHSQGNDSDGNSQVETSTAN